MLRSKDMEYEVPILPIFFSGDDVPVGRANMEGSIY